MTHARVWRFELHDGEHVVTYQKSQTAGRFGLPEEVVVDGSILQPKWERAAGLADGTERAFRFLVGGRRAVLHWSHFTPAPELLAWRRRLSTRVLYLLNPFYSLQPTDDEILGTVWLTVDEERVGPEPRKLRAGQRAKRLAGRSRRACKAGSVPARVAGKQSSQTPGRPTLSWRSTVLAAPLAFFAHLGLAQAGIGPSCGAVLPWTLGASVVFAAVGSGAAYALDLPKETLRERVTGVIVGVALAGWLIWSVWSLLCAF